MLLIAHEFVQCNTGFLAVRLHDNGRNFGHMAHFGRAVKASIVLSLTEFEDRLNVLLLGDDQIVAVQLKPGLHAYSNGTTLTVPVAVS